jgi:parallel beta-helix repeat protein
MDSTLASRRRMLIPVVALGLLAAGPAAAETRIGGTLSENTTWTKQQSPYVVTADVTVPPGVTLTIEPGVTVRFKPDITDMHGDNKFDLEMQVQGSLIAHGAEGDTIYFTTDAATPRWTDWQGIVAHGKKASVDLQAVNIEYSNQGIRVIDGSAKVKDVTVRFCTQDGINFWGGSGDLDNVLLTRIGNAGGTGQGVVMARGAAVNVRNSFIVGCQNGLSYSGGSGGVADNTVISMCTGRGIVVGNSSPTITHCTVTGNDYGIVIGGPAEPTVKQNNIFENGTAEAVLTGYTGSIVKVNLSGNWWGKTDVGAIQESIHDNLRDPQVKALAVIEPILTEATTAEADRRGGR